MLSFTTEFEEDGLKFEYAADVEECPEGAINIYNVKITDSITGENIPYTEQEEFCEILVDDVNLYLNNQ